MLVQDIYSPNYFNATIARRTSQRRQIETATRCQYIARRCAHPVVLLIVQRRGALDVIRTVLRGEITFWIIVDVSTIEIFRSAIMHQEASQSRGRKSIMVPVV
jgi:hypothetical protein